MGVQDVKWGKGGSESADNYTFLNGKWNADHHHLGTGIFVCNRTRPVLMKVQSISSRILYIILRGHWCDIVLNVHDPTVEKSYDTKDSINKELKHVSN
jgi:hypothetical protein